MKPASSDDSQQQEPQAVRPWERVRPSPPKDRQTRETFQPKAPSPVEEVLALHDEELEEEPPAADPNSSDSNSSDPDAQDSVICF